MLNRIVRSQLSLLLLLFIATTTVAACTDNPVEGDHDDHAEAEGLALVLNGTEVYRVLQGQVSCAQQPCGITVAPGSETPTLTIQFLAADGDVLETADLDDEAGLAYEIADPSVAEAEQRAGDGPWQFIVRGKQAGTTRMQLKLMHGDHPDFITPPLSDVNALTIRVEASR